MNFIPKNILAMFFTLSLMPALVSAGAPAKPIVPLAGVMGTLANSSQPTQAAVASDVVYRPISEITGDAIRTLASMIVGDREKDAPGIGTFAAEFGSALPGAITSGFEAIGNTYAYKSLMHHFKAPISTPKEGYSILASTDNLLSWSAKILVGGAIALTARHMYKNSAAVRTLVKIPFRAARLAARCTGQIVIGAGNLAIDGVQAAGHLIFG